MHRDGKIDSPVPFIKQNDDDKVSIISPLIQGVYCRDIDRYFTNPNFSPVFDPTGLKYSDVQINNLWFWGLENWIAFAKGRENGSFKRLTAIDKKAHNWDRVIKFYSSIYGETIKPHQEFVLSDEERALFKTKRL